MLAGQESRCVNALTSIPVVDLRQTAKGSAFGGSSFTVVWTSSLVTPNRAESVSICCSHDAFQEAAKL